MFKRNEEGFRLMIGYPHDTPNTVKSATPLPEKQFWALAKSLNLGPTNKEAIFGWSDDYGDYGFYLYKHDDSYALLKISMEAQAKDF